MHMLREDLGTPKFQIEITITRKMSEKTFRSIVSFSICLLGRPLFGQSDAS